MRRRESIFFFFLFFIVCWEGGFFFPPFSLMGERERGDDSIASLHIKKESVVTRERESADSKREGNKKEGQHARKKQWNGGRGWMDNGNKKKGRTV